jgi:hypothetical protein
MDVKTNTCFDWLAFILSTFLTDPRSYLYRLATLPSSYLVWPLRGSAGNGIPLLYSKVAHLVETIVSLELPAVSTAFRLAGLV